MRNKTGWFLGALVCASMTLGQAAVQDGDFPDTVSIAGYSRPLRLGGQATLHHQFVPYYLAALYVPGNPDARIDLSDALNPYRLELVWQVHTLDVEQVREYWRQALRTAAGEDSYWRIQPRVDQFAKLLPAVRHGDHWTFTYIPDAGMAVSVNNTLIGQLAGVEFNRALAAIWLGPSAPPDFRQRLLQGDNAALPHVAN